MDFKRIFHIRNEYTKNHLGFKEVKKKIIYLFGFKITLRRKIKMEIKNEERLNWLISKVTLLDKLIEEHKQHYAYSKEMYWNLMSEKLAPIQKSHITNKCLLLKYDNFWEIGKYCGPNLGDNIQTLAVKRLLDKFFIQPMAYEFVDRDCLTNYRGGGNHTV